MTTSRTPLWLGMALAAGLVTTAGCTSSDPADPTDPAPSLGEFRLVAFDSCEEAADDLRAAAREHVGPWGLGGGALAVEADMAQDGGLAAAPGGARAAVPEAAVEPGAPAHSGTNVHEAGVDEPDLVKTDGQRIVTVQRGRLRVVDAARRVEIGSVDLSADEDPDGSYWEPADLLLHGDHALALYRGSGAGWWGMPVEPGLVPDVAPEGIAGPRLVLVDLTGAPRVLAEYTIDGSVVDARQTGSVARVVVRSGPRLAFPWLEDDATEEERLAANRAAIDEADLADWLPRYETTVDGRSTSGQVDCTAVSRPASYTGTSMLTVLTFDLAAPSLGSGEPVSVVADGDTVYGNGSSLYVATDRRWAMGTLRMEDPAEIDDRTDIYKFDTSQPGPPRYAAAGTVDGWLINQYAMSEWDGHLRVATTSGETWWGGPETQSESAVAVLAQRGDELVVTGSVGGLGKGERIYSVRFVGPTGYVVTFRQTDPLYTVDLRDPAVPTVLGELKITGYSAYLHPIDDARLIGVGQEADTQGVTQGTQVSLFDVSDLSDPTLTAQHHVRYGHSEAEFDPHAFLWWPAERLLVVPLTTYDERTGWPDSGALVLEVGDRSFTEVGVVSHPAVEGGQWSNQIRRSLVIGDTLWTVSDVGLRANSLATLDELAWLPLR